MNDGLTTEEGDGGAQRRDIESTPEVRDSSLLVSVIVPTRNNIDTITPLIRSVFDQSTAGGLELLIVDGESTDSTPERAHQLGATVCSYRCNGDMRGFARNLGASRARGTYILFLDSDMELTEGVINECIESIEHGFDALVVPEVTVGVGLLGNVRAWERGLVTAHNYLAAARFLRLAVFRKVGGFDETILGFEDLDFQATLIEKQIKIGRTTRPIIHNEKRMRFRTYLEKRAYYQKTSGYYRLKHPDLARVVFSPIDRVRIYLRGVHQVSDLALITTAITLRTLEIISASRLWNLTLAR
jgi:glycosyltransferase involved in cell wall biosynthesis